MSLRIWLPLNGDLENKGLDNIVIANNGATIDDNGKIGKCYSFDGTNDYINITNANYPNIFAGSFSICFWVYSNTDGSRDVYFGNYGLSGSGNWFNIEKNTNNKLRFWWNNGSPNKYFTSYNILNSEGWTHIALTRFENTVKVYKNGTLIESYTVTLSNNVPTTATMFVIGGDYRHSGDVMLGGRMNDFRLYDECLSPMQIKLISQGLVAHYLLNNNGNGLPNYFRNSNFSTGTTTGWGGVNGSTISIEEIDNKKTITATKGTSNNLIRQFISGYKYVADTNISFVISADVYVTETGTLTIGQWISSSEVSGWQNMTGTGTFLTPNTLSLGWNHVIFKATKQNSYNGTIVVAFHYTGTTAYFTNLKFEFSDKPTSWCPNSTDSIYTQLGYDNNIEYDVSGYCNNGTKYNITEYVVNSPRYSLATKFNGTNSYINVGRGSMVKDEITINIWAYMDDWTTFKARLISCTEGGGWNFEPSGSKIHVGMGTGVSSNTYKNTSGYVLADLTSGWHMFTATYDGFITKQYVDGVFNTSYNAYTTKTPIFYHASNPVLIGAEASSTQNPAGSYFNGYLSDVRIYSTALSETDIQSLYNNSAFIDSSGNIYSTEYTEL